MTRDELLAVLNGAPTPMSFVESVILSRVPWIFSEDLEAYSLWRGEIAAQLSCGSEDVYLVGSAATGYSLSPLKAGRPFLPVRPGERIISDIDIAIVHPELFVEAWNVIVSFDRRRMLGRFLGRTLARTGLADGLEKMRFDVYHGTIGDTFALPGSLVSTTLRTMFSATTRRAPFIGHRPRARIYRRRQDLVDYHEQSLRRLLNSLRTPSRTP